MSMHVTVVMRAHNDMPLLERTLAALSAQTERFELIAFDNASTDGGRGLLERFAAQVFHVPEGRYIPGQVLNRAMECTSSELVVFLNADCEPLDPHWLSNLLGPFTHANVGAAFARQLPRPDCLPLAAFDTEASYGDGSRQAAWRNCFSMASCAIRRSVWKAVPFDESLGYSEDIAWSWQVRQSGREIRYVPAAQVYHSHNYNNAEWHKRNYGEGRAEASIFAWSPWERTLLRYSILPFVKQVMRDVGSCASSRRWDTLLHIPGYRFAQMVGRRQGFIAGLREQEAQPQPMLTAESL